MLIAAICKRDNAPCTLHDTSHARVIGMGGVVLLGTMVYHLHPLIPHMSRWIILFRFICNRLPPEITHRCSTCNGSRSLAD